jgi:2-polyprenyl-3-methyl-5-hydroxy-6-metoxy-1,4-benzoquinol methylase
MITNSPITGKMSSIVDTFRIESIIQGYQKEYNIDVSDYFEGMGELPIYECSDSKLRFFSPAKLAGDGKFYSLLEDFPEYYANWKWEYEAALKYISSESKVLDIGCGRGAFLEKLKEEKNCIVKGLEFNPSALKVLQEKGIDATMETIESHAQSNKAKYDVVTFFQVLEHIANVKDFITAATECLKPGGIMIVAVPNNEPYLFGINKYEWLNLPPHHMGWWNKTSLENLTKFYPLNVEKIEVKPFRDYNSYVDAVERNSVLINPLKIPFLKATRFFRKQWIQIKRDTIPGFFIMAVYVKNT